MRNILEVLLAIVSFAAVTTNAGRVATIRDIDFDNFTYAWNDASDDAVPMDWKWIDSRPDGNFSAVNGIHDF